MGELEDRLSSILNDPEQMRRISSLAQTLMGGGETSAPAEKTEQEQDRRKDHRKSYAYAIISDHFHIPAWLVRVADSKFNNSITPNSFRPQILFSLLTKSKCSVIFI